MKLMTKCKDKALSMIAKHEVSKELTIKFLKGYTSEEYKNYKTFRDNEAEQVGIENKEKLNELYSRNNTLIMTINRLEADIRKCDCRFKAHEPKHQPLDEKSSVLKEELSTAKKELIKLKAERDRLKLKLIREKEAREVGIQRAMQDSKGN